MKATSYQLTFIKKIQRTRDVVSFFFEKPANFDYLPGQYLYMTIPHEADDRGTTRYFTISASPAHKELMITTKILDGRSTFKQKLDTLKPGDSVTAFGPMGTFVLDETDDRHHIFLAGGIGMTPYYSMITYIIHKNLTTPVTLLVSFSSDKEKVFYEELTTLSANNPQLRIVYVSGQLSEDIIRSHTKPLQNPRYFLVGPSAMVEATKQMLTKLGIREENVMVEDFHGYEHDDASID